MRNTAVKVGVTVAIKCANYLSPCMNLSNPQDNRLLNKAPLLWTQDSSNLDLTIVCLQGMKMKNLFMVVLAYVDDLIITGNYLKVITQAKNLLIFSLR